MTHRPLLSVVLLVSLAALLPCGCGKREPGPKQVAGPTIRFAYQDRIADAVSIIAVEKDLFAAEGLAVESFVFSSGPACSEALVTGSADIGTMGDTTAVIAAARAPVKIIASHGGGEHRHRIIVADASPIRSPDDLAGRSVAVKKGTSTYGGLLAWADSHGLDLSAVRVVDMRPPDMAEALLSGAVDAVVASEPTPSLVEDRGGRELATLGGLGNTYPIMLLARDEFLADHGEAVRKFMRAMHSAASFISRHPEDAAAIIAAKSGMSSETVGRAMSHHYYRLQLDDATTASLSETADFLVAEQTLEASPEWERTVDRSFVSNLR